MRKGEVGCVYANQGQRHAEIVEVKGGRALLVYDMPNGRSFFWDIPESASWHSLQAEGWGNIVRNVSANKPPKRWAAEIAKTMGRA